MTMIYSDTLPGGCHWSMLVRRGHSLRLIDLEGGANLAMLFYNPNNLLERYNAPDTLKCQHTFKLSKGNCLYSDMGRVFCSITEDSHGWHDTVCGNANKNKVAEKWGELNYQQAQNKRHQNGYDAFLVEIAKYGLGKKDMAANLNLFSKVAVDDEGNMAYDATANEAGHSLELRFEMDTLVVMHTCPHPLAPSGDYPFKSVRYELYKADPVADDDYCKNFCEENQRGFENNRIYHFSGV